jgi:hypothetical protein
VIWLPLPRWFGFILGPIAILFGLAVAFFGWWRWDSASTLAARGVTVTAQVIEAREIDEDGETVVYLTHEYVVGSETIRREDRIAPELYTGGDTIEVVYDPQSPREHMVSGTRVVRSVMQMQMVGGVLAMLVGVYVFYGARRRDD